MSNVPKGFEPIFRSSPYLDLLGPIYNKKSESGLIIAFRAVQKHCNTRNLVHGGVFSSLADIALGYKAAFKEKNPVPMVTASLTVDYTGSAKLGDRIEIVADVQKVGRNMAFANSYSYVESKRIATASVVINA